MPYTHKTKKNKTKKQQPKKKHAKRVVFIFRKKQTINARLSHMSPTNTKKMEQEDEYKKAISILHELEKQCLEDNSLNKVCLLLYYYFLCIY
jgi:hypothetical protein